MQQLFRYPRREAVVAAVLFLWMIIGASSLAQTAPTPSLAPLNPDYVRFSKAADGPALPVDPSVHPAGLVPETVIITDGRRVTRASTLSTLPVAYDLRSVGNKLTLMRNQGSCGACWAFAAFGSLESTLLPTESWDFSENNLRSRHGFNPGCCDGGNRTMATAYLARWDGPVAEADDPYIAETCSANSNFKPKKHIQEVLYLPNRTGPTDNDAIKQAVMNYGAVYTTYYENSANYSSANRAYYYHGSSSTNHAICIVGWDDNFPASKFNTTPPANGAFIIRNSWGGILGRERLLLYVLL